MANWCNNTVIFSGARVAEALEWVKSKALDDEGIQFFEDKDGRCLFSIYVEEDYLSFETKWSPEIKQIQFIADKFGLDFEYSYTELGMLVVGEYCYKDSTLTHTALTPEDFDQITFDEEGVATFRGEEYECEEEIFEILIKEKQHVN